MPTQFRGTDVILTTTSNTQFNHASTRDLSSVITPKFYPKMSPVKTVIVNLEEYTGTNFTLGSYEKFQPGFRDEKRPRRRVVARNSRNKANRVKHKIITLTPIIALATLIAVSLQLNGIAYDVENTAGNARRCRIRFRRRITSRFTGIPVLVTGLKCSVYGFKFSAGHRLATKSWLEKPRYREPSQPALYIQLHTDIHTSVDRASRLAAERQRIELDVEVNLLNSRFSTYFYELVDGC